MKLEQIIALILGCGISLAIGIHTGSAIAKSDFIAYCKEDGAYLDKGLFIQCSVKESGLSKK